MKGRSFTQTTFIRAVAPFLAQVHHWDIERSCGAALPWYCGDFY